MPFVDVGELLFFGGGAREIAERLRENETLPDVAATVVVREPSLGTDAYFMFQAKDFLEAIRRVLNADKPPAAETVLEALERASSKQAPVREAPREGSPASVVVRDDRFEGAWLPELEPEHVIDLTRVERMRDLPAMIQTYGASPRQADAFTRVFGPGRGGHTRPPRLRPRRRGGKPVVGVAPPFPRAANGGHAAEPATSEEAAAAVLKRTPHLDAPEEIPRAAGSKFDVSVRVDTSGFGKGEEGEWMRIELPADVDRVEVGVLLNVTRHFEIVGPSFRELTIARDEDESGPVDFKLRVAENAPGGFAGISAVFIYNLRPTGRVERTWSWTGRAKVAKARTGRGEVRTGPSVPFEGEPPDLTVVITGPVENERRFKCALVTGLVPGFERPKSSEWVLSSKADEFVKNELAKFSKSGSTPRKRLRALNSAGRAFWAAAPEEFRTLLRKMVEDGKAPRTIYVDSIEPSMPWELITPGWANEKGIMEWRPPLGASYAIARWVRNDGVPPPPARPVRASVLVAPAYTGDDVLDSSQEQKLLSKRLGGRVVPKATLQKLDDYLESSPATLLHFACHGEVTDEGEILILEDDDLLSAELPDFDGFKAVCAKNPLVFLNACDTGRLSESLIGGAGFPLTLGEMGASGVIAPLWPVEDKVASKVAVELYTRALDEPNATIPMILRDLRRKAYDKKAPEDSYAAYAFYGDPWARIESAE